MDSESLRQRGVRDREKIVAVCLDSGWIQNEVEALLCLFQGFFWGGFAQEHSLDRPSQIL